MSVVVAAAVVIRDRRVLLTQRVAGAHLGGKWELPGGKVEPDEDPRVTVVRECREECGIDLEPEDILDVTFHRYPEKSVLLLFYKCRWVHGEVQHLGVAGHAWASASELDGFDLPPADRPVLTKIRALLTGPLGP